MSQNVHIYYIFHGRFPSEKAHALFAAMTCDAFQELGYKVKIVVPDRRSLEVDPKEFFKLNYKLPVVRLRAPDYHQWSIFRHIMFYLSHIIFGFQVRRYLKDHIERGDIVYTNQSLELPWLPKGHVVCYELHDFPSRFFFLFRWLYSYATRILITNQWKSKEFKTKFPELHERTFIEMNAVDVDQFDIQMTKEEAQQKLGMDSNKKVVMYTGHLYAWKGVDTLAGAARLLSDDHLVYFVGGTEKDVERFRQKYGNVQNVHIVGYQPHDEIPVWQKAADVLVLPNTAKEDISKYYTSPMKLFEYMASNVPIVASKLPSVEEVVSSREVFFFTPDNQDDLMNVIMTALYNKERSSKKANAAFEKVGQHTWKKRAERVIERMQV